VKKPAAEKLELRKGEQASPKQRYYPTDRKNKNVDEWHAMLQH